jgi:RNA polymerase sigma factor (TIGR02999 family)
VEPTISALIASADAGDRSALDALFSALYRELHQLARRQLAGIGADGTLGTTTLLHEAYLDVSGRGGAAFPDRARFMAYASRVMRGLIIDHARNRRARKRGGRFEITSLPTEVGDDSGYEELARIGRALDELAIAAPLLAELVDLKFFCGFSFIEIAAMRGLSERTVQRQWEKARIFLHETIQDEPTPPH